MDNAAVKWSRRPVHQTQWAAQFAVASELCKLGYEVALTLGNHPTADLMVYSPAKTPFVIDVKGLHKRNYWLVKEKPDRPDAFYIFALVPHGASNRFFILTQAEVNTGIKIEFDRAYKSAREKGRSTDKVRDWAGVSFSYAEAYENSWDKLPD